MSTKNSLLLVDADARSLRVLEVSLKKAGFEVLSAATASAALAQADQRAPELVVLDPSLPDLDGYALAETLRAHPSAARAGIIFLSADTTPESKIRAIAAGADDFVGKPVLVKDLLARVVGLLEKRQTDAIARRERPTNLGGTLASMGVVDLLQLMESGAKSGIVHVSSDPAKSGGFVTEAEARGTIFFRDGQVIDARLGRLAGASAVYRMLLWDDGVFEVEFKPVSRDAAVAETTQAILLEGMKRVDEWTRFVALAPPLSSKLTIDFKALAESVGNVPAVMRNIVQLFDGRRTLLEVIGDASGDEPATLGIIAKLHEHGVLISPAGGDAASEEAALQAFLSAPARPRALAIPNIPSALGRAVIPSPGEQVGSADAFDFGWTESPAPSSSAETTELPEPLPEPSLVLSRHTVPANRAIPLVKKENTGADEPIPLTERSQPPKLRIQRMTSGVSTLPLSAPGAREPAAPQEANASAAPTRPPERNVAPAAAATTPRRGSSSPAHPAPAAEPAPESARPARSNLAAAAHQAESPLAAARGASAPAAQPHPAPSGLAPASDARHEPTLIVRPDAPRHGAFARSSESPFSAPRAGAELRREGDDTLLPRASSPPDVGPAAATADARASERAAEPSPSNADTQPPRAVSAPEPDRALAAAYAPNAAHRASERGAASPGSAAASAAESTPAPSASERGAAPPGRAAASAAEAPTERLPPLASPPAPSPSRTPAASSAARPPAQPARAPARPSSPDISDVSATFFERDRADEDFGFESSGRSVPWPGILVAGAVVGVLAVLYIGRPSRPPGPTTPEELAAAAASRPAPALTQPAPAAPGAATSTRAAAPVVAAPPASTAPAAPPSPAPAAPPSPAPAAPAAPSASAASPAPAAPAPAAAASPALERAEAALAKERFAVAIREFRAILAADPASAPAHSGLARALVESGKDDEAKREAERALELDARAARAHLVLGIVAYNKGSKAAARKAFEAYLALEPTGKSARDVRDTLKTLR
jgi:CheY-like chemotaxis protein